MTCKREIIITWICKLVSSSFFRDRDHYDFIIISFPAVARHLALGFLSPFTWQPCTGTNESVQGQPFGSKAFSRPNDHHKTAHLPALLTNLPKLWTVDLRPLIRTLGKKLSLDNQSCYLSIQQSMDRSHSFPDNLLQTKKSFNQWFESVNVYSTQGPDHVQSTSSSASTPPLPTAVITSQPKPSPLNQDSLIFFDTNRNDFNAQIRNATTNKSNQSQITYTSVAQFKHSVRNKTDNETLFRLKQNENFQNFYRQKLISGKVLFQNSKLKNLDMVDSLFIRQQSHSVRQLNQDTVVRRFNVCGRDGQPMFKAVEGMARILFFKF